MKKTLFLAATGATVVATSVAPVQAANFTDVSKSYEPAVNYLVSQNIASGISASKFGTDVHIKRGDAAVMIAKALKLDTKNAPDAGFKDVSKRAQPYVNALHKAGIANGLTKDTFGVERSITRGELAIMLAKGYNLKAKEANIPFTDVNKRYAPAVAALVEHKVTQGTSAKTFGTSQPVKRGDFAMFIYRLSGGKTPAPKPPVVTGKPVVTGVDLNNPFKATVHFGVPLVREEAEKHVKYEVNGHQPYIREVSKDRKSVVLHFRKSIETGKAKKTFLVTPIYTDLKNSVDGRNIPTEKYEVAYQYEDVVAPVLQKVSHEGATLTLTYSEPLSKAPTSVVVDGKTIDSKDVVLNTKNTHEVFVRNVSLPAQQQVTVEATGAIDQSMKGNVSPKQSVSFKSSERDTVAPKVNAVSLDRQLTGERLMIELSEEVQEKEFEVTLVHNGTEKTVKVDRQSSTDLTKYHGLLSPNDILPEGVNEATYDVKVKSGTLTDPSGNKNEEQTLSLRLVRDTDAPKLVKAEVSADHQKFILTFDEAIYADEGLTKTIVESGGKTYPIVEDESKINANQLLIDIVPDQKAMTPGDYVITLPKGLLTDVHDNANTGAIKTPVLKVTPYEPSKGAVIVNSGMANINTFSITFSHALTDDALQPEHYRLKGQPLPKGTDIAFKDNNLTTVLITLPKGSITEGGTGGKNDDYPKPIYETLTIDGLKDEYGHTVDQHEVIVELTDNRSAELQTSIWTSNSVHVLTYDEKLRPFEKGTKWTDAFTITYKGEPVKEEDVHMKVYDRAVTFEFHDATLNNKDVSIRLKNGQRALKDWNGYPVGQ